MDFFGDRITRVNKRKLESIIAALTQEKVDRTFKKKTYF